MSLLLLINMLDGSQVNLNVDRAIYFDVGTKYGTLKVPVANVAKINFGVHYDDEELYKNAIKEFASGKYKSRDGAFKFLAQNQRWAWKWLKSVENDNNLEVKNRAIALLKLYKASPSLLDDVVLKDGAMAGRIQQKEISGESVSLGKMTVRISQIKSITARQPNEVVKISVTKSWVKVGFVDGSCEVNAIGVIDFFPQQPGQYTYSAGGSTNGTMNGGYPIGALLGRLNGTTFLIGEHFYAQNIGRGDLEVMINPPTWSGPYEGEYDVKVE